MLRRMVVDWRGIPDFSTKDADFYSCYWTAGVRPPLWNPGGRVLVCWQPAVLFYNTAVSDRAYNKGLYAAALQHGAMTDKVLSGDPFAWHTKLVDITKRGMVADMLALHDKHHGWADGVHGDWWTAMSWAWPELAPLDDLWDRSLAAFATGLRAKGKLVLAQQFHPTAPSSACNGQFWEQSPTSFTQTLESHASDAAMFRDTLRFAKDTRETLFVAEVREPARFPQPYLDAVRAWCQANDFVLSCGRDGTAEGA